MLAATGSKIRDVAAAKKRKLVIVLAVLVAAAMIIPLAAGLSSAGNEDREAEAGGGQSLKCSTVVEQSGLMRVYARAVGSSEAYVAQSSIVTPGPDGSGFGCVAWLRGSRRYEAIETTVAVCWHDIRDAFFNFRGDIDGCWNGDDGLDLPS